LRPCAVVDLDQSLNESNRGFCHPGEFGQRQRVLRKARAAKAGPGLRNLGPMRLSSPMPRETSNTSASTRSQRSAMPRNRFAVVSNPEFLREGAAIEDFKQPERVIGVEDDERARLVIAKIYEPLSLSVRPHHRGDRARRHRDRSAPARLSIGLRTSRTITATIPRAGGV
jgi:hypothetical protein